MAARGAPWGETVSIGGSCAAGQTRGSQTPRRICSLPPKPAPKLHRLSAARQRQVPRAAGENGDVVDTELVSETRGMRGASSKGFGEEPRGSSSKGGRWSEAPLTEEELLQQVMRLNTSDDEFLGLGLEDMERALGTLQAHVSTSLKALDRAAAGMVKSAGLEGARQMQDAIRAETEALETRMQGLVEGLKELRSLKEAADTPGVPGEVMERVVQKGLQLHEELGELAQVLELTEQAVQGLREDGDADMDALFGMEAASNELHREMEKLQRASEELSRNKSELDHIEAASSMGKISDDVLDSEIRSAFTSPEDEAEYKELRKEWELLREDRKGVKESLADMFQSLVALVRSGDRDGAVALAEANAASVAEQIAAKEAGVEQAAMLCSLALFFFGLGTEQGAERGENLLQQALKLCSESDPQPLLDDVLENAADILYGMERYTDAIPLYLSSLQVQIILEGGPNPAQASTLSSLANAYAECGLLDDAVEMQSKALGIVQQARGEASLGAATLLVRLSQLQALKGAMTEATDNAQRALDIVVSCKGTESVEAAIATCTLADVLRAQGDEPGAASLLEKALETFRGCATAASRRKLERMAQLTELGGTPASSEQVAAMQAEDEEHPAVNKAREDLASIYESMERYEEGLQLRREILQSVEEELGPVNPGLVPALVNLGTAYIACSKNEGAEKPLTRALNLARASVPALHPMLLVPVERMCHCLLRMERFQEAEPLAREAVQIVETSPSLEPQRLGDCLQQLGFVLVNQDKYGEAESILYRALQICDQHYGPRSEESELILGMLVVALEEQGKLQAAARCMQRLHRARA